MFDELEKLAEISLAGLSPQRALESGAHAMPMETSGYDKAVSILNRAQASPVVPQVKTAAPRVPFNADLPAINSFTGAKKRKKRKHEVAVERGKSLAGHTLGGMGIGRLVGEMSHGPKVPMADAARQALHGKRWWGAVAGGSIGVGEFVRKRIMDAKEAKMEKKSSIPAISSPGRALQASRQVAKVQGHGRMSGPSLRGQLGGRVLGRKFIPPGA
jgi:hypothetical protein